MIANGNILCKVVTVEDKTPIVRGHIIDGASTFTFNNTVVNVDGNGWWEYTFNTNTIDLGYAYFGRNNNLDILIFRNYKITNIVSAFSSNNSYYSVLRLIDLSTCDLSECEDARTVFSNLYMLEKIKFPKNFFPKRVDEMFSRCQGLSSDNFRSDFWKNVEDFGQYGPFTNCDSVFYVDFSSATKVTQFRDTYTFRSKIIYLKLPDLSNGVTLELGRIRIQSLRLLEIDNIDINISLPESSVLYKQSVLNLINAAKASITITLHSTVYAKCANGGEWYTDVQAAIDAKVLEGYTVTLISA